MERNLLVSGFGGQGVMLLGKLLSYSACEAVNTNVTFFPSYGAEQRGGAASCYVVISDKMIGAPVADIVEDFIAMNETALQKFVGKLKPGGNLFVNSSIIKGEIPRNDVNVIKIPALETALEIGSEKTSNFVMLGAYIAATKVVEPEIIKTVMKNQLGSKPQFIQINETAFNAGMSLIKGSN